MTRHDTAETVSRKPGRGEFFAIDRRVWAHVCQYNINAMTAYLVLARGTGHDQRTTSWSINAVTTYTSMSVSRAQVAVNTLVRASLVLILQGGKRPRYRLMPAHEVPGCEGFPPANLDADEQSVFDHFVSGAKPIPENSYRWTIQRDARTVAASLVTKGVAKPVGEESAHCYSAIIYDAEAAAKPDWIWLPNALVDNVAGETAPIELIRQTQSHDTMRLLINLYHAHSLPSDGGVHWRSIQQTYTREKVGQRGPFIVYGFRPGGELCWSDKLLIRAHLTGEFEADKKRDRGLQIFWNAFQRLKDFGLVELVGHLIEADNSTASIIHSYAVDCGEAAERLLATSAHEAGRAMLTEGQREWADRQKVHLAPVRAHITEVQMVGIARLRYRPRTSATAVWFARMAECDEMTVLYDEMAAEARGEIIPVRAQYQGRSRWIKVPQRGSTGINVT